MSLALIFAIILVCIMINDFYNHFKEIHSKGENDEKGN